MEDKIDKEEKKNELEEKLRLLRLNSLQPNKKMLKALQQKHRYSHTRAGKTKRS